MCKHPCTFKGARARAREAHTKMTFEERVLARLRQDHAQHGPLTFRVAKALSGQPGFDLMTYRSVAMSRGSLSYLHDADQYTRLPPTDKSTRMSMAGLEHERVILARFYDDAAKRINMELMREGLFDHTSSQSQSHAEHDQHEHDCHLVYQAHQQAGAAAKALSQLE